MPHNLENLFNPQSLAVIGAAREEQKIGHIVLNNILSSGFTGKIYPINPHANKIGTLDCYPNFEALPEAPDLAIIAIPAIPAVELLSVIAQKGTKNVLIYGAGFKEAGEDGKKLEKQLQELAKKYHLNIIGPNCLGFINNTAHLNATFGRIKKNTGNISFISQSGAIATGIFDWADNSQMGIDTFVTLGNKAVIGENEVLEYFLSLPSRRDKKVSLSAGLSRYHPIGLYLESIEKGSAFLPIIKKITRTNPVFILKPGKSTGAQQAMQSHTGAMAGEDAVIDAALKESGIIRCDGVEDFFDLSRALAWENAPAGPNLAVISNAGGPAVISTDIIAEVGLQIAPINPKTHTLLQKYLPAAASIQDPIDVLGDALADRYAKAIDLVLNEKEVHALLVILTPQMMTQIEDTARTICEQSAKHKKPIVCSFIGGSAIEKGEQILNLAKIPSFRFPERAIRALGKMWWWRRWQVGSNCHSDWSDEGAERRNPLTRATQRSSDCLLRHRETSTALRSARNDKRGILTGLESDALLRLAKITTPPTTAVEKISDAKKFTQKYGWPVVLKISSAELLHKTEAGGVITNITNNQELRHAWQKMEKHIRHFVGRRRGVLTYAPSLSDTTVKIQIQKQVESGLEVIVGIKRDPSFGPVLMFGAGGTMAELIQDRNLALFPLDENKILELVNRSKIIKLLKGYRGEKPYQVAKLVDLMVKLGSLVENILEIKEIEINPVIVTHKNVWAVDGKVILSNNR